jgi:SAM-dependent methyltransferase
VLKDEHGMQQRVAGTHSIRLDGIQDIITRFKGSSVLDIGCNRGTVCIDAERNGASLVHGCDIDETCILGLKGLFADYRHVRSHFAVVDLTEGPRAFLPFAGQQYDIVLMLATYHKIKRMMNPEPLSDLMRHIGSLTKNYFGWRATSDKPEENEQEMKAIDKDLGKAGLYRIHTSYISKQLGVAAIWERR